MTDPAPRPTLGLALGGGGALGWAHLGVLQVLSEEGIVPGVITGTSIGSLVGACEVAGKRGALEEIAISMTRLNMMKLADVQIGKNGFLGGDPVVKELRRHLGHTKIENLARPFGAMATDLVRGAEVPFTSGDLVEAVRASISIPGVFTPVRIGDELLVDGGLLNNVPVSLAHDLGAKKVIAVNVTADFEGRAITSGIVTGRKDQKDPSDAPKPKQALSALGESLSRYLKKEDSEPSLVGVSLTAVALLMRELGRAQLAACPADITLEPDVGRFTMMEFDQASALIDEGRKEAERLIPDIRRVLEI